MLCRARVIAIVLGMAWLMAAAGSTVYAQTGPARLEIGGQGHVSNGSGASDASIGFGGRVTVNVTPWLGVEGEYQFFPSDDVEMRSVQADGGRAGIRYERRRSTAVFGAKAGYRGDRVGVFGKVRPGFTQLTDRGVECLGDVCALMILAIPEYRREFVVDVGAVVEVYPSPRWLARVDVGSLVIRHRSTAPPCVGGGCTTGNLAASFGVGVRF